MKYIKYLCYTFILLFVFNLNVKAEDCDSNDINYLKQLSQRVTYQYDYVGLVDFDSSLQTYEVYFENLGNDFYVSIQDKGNTIVFDKDGEKERIDSGEKGFTVYSSKCYSAVNYIKVNLPKFNYYSQNDFCVLHPDLDICGEWYQEDISAKEFNDIVKRYENEESNFFSKLLGFIINYYYAVIPVTIILLLLIIMIIKRGIKSNKLD